MRIACVLIHNLAIQLALTSDPTLRGRPLVIGGLPLETQPVYDASAEAIACGIKHGMLLYQASGLCPEATFLPSDERRYEEVFEEVVNILEKFSPVVDIEELGCVYLDVSGVHSEQSLAREISASISADTGLGSCLGICSGKFFSRVAALTSRPGAPVVVSEGKEEDFIAAFSIDFLPCSAETREHLQMLGIRFIGQLSEFSKEALVAQFGRDGILVRELAHGIDRTSLTARKKPEVVVDAVEIDPPAVAYVELLQSCQVMLERMLSSIKAQGKVCREVLLRISFTAGAVQERRLYLKEATGSTATILSRLRTWLESIMFPAPAIEVGLSLFPVREQGKRLYLWPEQQRMRKGLSKAASEFRLRFGYQPLKKVQTVEPSPIIPERRFRLIDALE